MLVINIIFVISAVYSVAIPSIVSASSVTSTKSKRRTLHNDQDSRNSDEQSRESQVTPRISSSEDINSRSVGRYKSAKVPDSRESPYTNKKQGSGAHAYGSVPKRPLSHSASSDRQTESQHSPPAPYFDILNNPSTYGAAISGERPLDGSRQIVSPSLQKLQETYSPGSDAFYQDKSIELSDFSDISEYPSYYSISKIIGQGIQSDASSHDVQVPVYKTHYPLSKINGYAHTYAPSFASHEKPSSAVALFPLSSDKTTQSAKYHGANIEENDKKILIPIIQLQSNPKFSGVLPAFEGQPFLLSTNYPAESDHGFNFDIGPKFNVALQSKNTSPFLSPMSSFQGQIVPIQTASSTPQFPQYKGASIEAYSIPGNIPKAQGSYEHLRNQPQLHFGKEHGGEFANVQQNAVHPSISTEDILEDVEIINKKMPEPHPSQSDDDDDEDERYKGPEKDDGQSTEDDDAEREPEKYFKESPTQSDFMPSTSFPFKEYDERFGKHKAKTDDENTEDKPYSTNKNQPSSGNDEEEEDSSSRYRAESHNGSPEESYESYEEEHDEEVESRKQEKRKGSSENSDEVEPQQQSKHYGKDLEREHEEFYRKESPKGHVRVKEVQEIDGYNNSKPSKQQANDDYQSRENQERVRTPKSQQARTSRKYRKTPKTDYRESVYGSNVSARNTPKAIPEQFLAHKNIQSGKYAKRTRADDAKYQRAKKPPKEDSYLRAAKYYKLNGPKSGVAPTAITANSYSSSSSPSSSSTANNWKSRKNSLERAAPRSNVRQLADPSDRTSFYAPSAVSGQVRSLTNAEILRDLTGI